MQGSVLSNYNEWPKSAQRQPSPLDHLCYSVLGLCQSRIIRAELDRRLHAHQRFYVERKLPLGATGVNAAAKASYVGRALTSPGIV